MPPTFYIHVRSRTHAFIRLRLSCVPPYRLIRPTSVFSFSAHLLSQWHNEVYPVSNSRTPAITYTPRTSVPSHSQVVSIRRFCSFCEVLGARAALLRSTLKQFDGSIKRTYAIRKSWEMHLVSDSLTICSWSQRRYEDRVFLHPCFFFQTCCSR